MRSSLPLQLHLIEKSIEEHGTPEKKSKNYVRILWRRLLF